MRWFLSASVIVSFDTEYLFCKPTGLESKRMYRLVVFFVSLMMILLLLGCSSRRINVDDYKFGYGKNIFTDNGLYIPSTYETFKETDFRVERYCRGFKRAAYYGETRVFERPLGIFITRVLPRDGDKCTVFGFFSKTASEYPLQIYPFRSDFNGTESITTTNNFHGVGSVNRLFHTMRINGYRLIYKAQAYDAVDNQGSLIEAVLYEVKDLKSYVPAVEAELEQKIVDDL